MSFALGTAVHDITPPPGLPMGGYAARSDAASDTLDRLCCRAAVVRRNAETAALLVLDLLYIAEPWAGEARRRVAAALGCEPSAVMLAATHTHAGPAVFRSALTESAELDAYERRLLETVVAGATEASRRSRPVTFCVGTVRVDGVAANRQEPGAAIDAAARVLVARAGEDLVATIAAFGCHPTVLSASNLSYSRDLFGAAVDALEAATGAPALLCNGAAADVSTRFTRREQSPAEMRRLGEVLAAAIAEAVENALPLAGGAMVAGTVEVAVKPRVFPPVDEARRRVAEAAANVEAQRSHVSAAELRRLTAQVEGALGQLYFSEHGGAGGLLRKAPETATVQLLRLGGCDLLAAPGEVFSAAARTLRAQRSRPALLIGYANDYLGYLTPPGSGEGYEAAMALLEGDSTAAVMQALAEIGEAASPPAPPALVAGETTDAGAEREE